MDFTLQPLEAVVKCWCNHLETTWKHLIASEKGFASCAKSTTVVLVLAPKNKLNANPIRIKAVYPVPRPDWVDF